MKNIFLVLLFYILLFSTTYAVEWNENSNQNTQMYNANVQGGKVACFVAVDSRMSHVILEGQLFENNKRKPLSYEEAKDSLKHISPKINTKLPTVATIEFLRYCSKYMQDLPYEFKNKIGLSFVSD